MPPPVIGGEAAPAVDGSSSSSGSSEGGSWWSWLSGSEEQKVRVDGDSISSTCEDAIAPLVTAASYDDLYAALRTRLLSQNV